jgi:hypothetical protein
VALIFSFLCRSQDLVTATLAICCVLLLSARRVIAVSRRWTEPQVRATVLATVSSARG